MYVKHCRECGSYPVISYEKISKMKIYPTPGTDQKNWRERVVSKATGKIKISCKGCGCTRTSNTAEDAIKMWNMYSGVPDEQEITLYEELMWICENDRQSASEPVKVTSGFTNQAEASKAKVVHVTFDGRMESVAELVKNVPFIAESKIWVRSTGTVNYPVYNVWYGLADGPDDKPEEIEAVLAKDFKRYYRERISKPTDTDKEDSDGQ